MAVFERFSLLWLWKLCLRILCRLFIRYIGGLLGVNYILNRHFISENAWRRWNCEGAEYVSTFSVQTNSFSRIIGGLMRLAD